MAVRLLPPLTAEDVGASQGVEWRDGRLYVYGDGETGVIREYEVVDGEAIRFTGRDVRLTVDGQDRIAHPTGFTVHPDHGTFLGDTVAGVGRIYRLDWAAALTAGTLDEAIASVALDDLAANGTRPEFVRLGSDWLIATADYGDERNAVRLYDPVKLARAARTSEAGLLVADFDCGPWVQNLHWIDERGILVLVQNQIEGLRWRLTFVDLVRSIDAGRQVVLQQVDLLPDDELEGFTLVGRDLGLLVSSSPRDNVRLARFDWTGQLVP